MASQKAKTKDPHICEKCGGIMITIVITQQNSEAIKLVKIFQCKTCRHWEPVA